MTQYISCRGCLVDRHKCENRKAIREAVKGLGLTSIRFACKSRISRFRAGQRVLVMWKFDGGLFDGGLEEVQFKATVLKEPKPGRFHILVDEGRCHSCYDEPDDYIAPDCLIGNGYATATYSRLTALDEPDAVICGACGGPKGSSDCFGNWGNLCEIEEVSK